MSDYCKRCAGPEPILCVNCVIEKDAIDRAAVGCPVGSYDRLSDELEKAKVFIRELILAHKATKSEDHYQTTGNARRFIGMDTLDL